MATPTPAPAPTTPATPRRPGRLAYAFLRSTWITGAWNWFLMLAGKAAEPVLTVSVIYSCARLLPGVHPPAALDNTIFISQMIALDIGGLGLRKLANQAHRDGNEAGSLLAGRVSTALLTIMGVNVALSVLESITPLDPNVAAMIEGVLLIARAIMAVLYAYVIHSLHSEQDENTPTVPTATPAPIVPQADIQQMIDQALTAALAKQPAPAATVEIDQQAIIAGVVMQFEDRFTTALKRLEQMEHRAVTVSPAPSETATAQVKRLPAAVKQPGETAAHTRAEVKRPGPGETSASAGPRLISLPSRTAPTTSQPERRDPVSWDDTRAAIYTLLDEDSSRQPAELARLTGAPRTTAWRWWKRWHHEHGGTVQADEQQDRESETA